MLLSTRDGIRCDRCGGTHKDDFTYYSFDFKLLQIVNNRLPQLDYSDRFVFSLDICIGCYAELMEILKQKYKPYSMLPDRSVPGGIICELSGTMMKGTYDLFHCIVSEIKVSVSGKPYTCIKCHNISVTRDIPCKCSCVDFYRKADTTIDKRHVELFLCSKVYEELRNRASTLTTHQELSKWHASSEPQSQ